MRLLASRRFCLAMMVLLTMMPLAIGQEPDTPNTPPRSSPPPQPIPEVSHAPQGSKNNDQESGFVFKKEVEEVVLHATVVDPDHRLETHLARNDFFVFEDGRPQTITSFRQEDVPVAIGIVVDNSGSMRDKRQKVTRGVLDLIRASNPNDQVFVVNFNRNPYLDQDFTSNVGLLETALHQVSMQGDTALYDAIYASAVHLENNREITKKVLLVITDGEDNMSRETLEGAIRELQRPNGPTLYAIGLTGGELQPAGRQALQRLAHATGGAAFFPQDLNEVEDIAQQLAHDIRSQYIIAYKPSEQDLNANFHPIVVEARAPGLPQLTVRTRTGVFTGESTQ